MRPARCGWLGFVVVSSVSVQRFDVMRPIDSANRFRRQNRGPPNDAARQPKKAKGLGLCVSSMPLINKGSSCVSLGRGSMLLGSLHVSTCPPQH